MVNVLSPAHDLRCDDDAAESFAAFGVCVRGRGFGEREAPVDLDPQLAGRDARDQVGDHLVDPGLLGYQRPGEVDPAQSVVVLPQIRRCDVGAGPAGHPDTYEGSSVGKSPDAFDQVLAADGIEDHVHAAPVGQLANARDEVLARVVDPMVKPEFGKAFEFILAGRGRDDGCAGLFRELDRGHADASCASVNQCRLPCVQVAGGEEALLGRPEGDRNTCRSRCVQPTGDGPAGCRWNRPF